MTRALILCAVAGCAFDGGGLAAPDAAAPGVDAPVGLDAPADAPPIAPDAAPLDAPPPPPPGTLVAPAATGAVTLDGDDAEFVAAGAAFLAWAIEDGDLYRVDAAPYQPSATVRFAALHDATYLYFFAEVTDAVQQVDSGTSLWEDDGVAIYLDVLGDALGPPGADDHELLVRADGTWDDYGTEGLPALGDVVDVADATGYRLEMRFRKDSLNAPVGDALGFDLLLTDDDGWQDDQLDAIGLWFTSARPTCATCCTAEAAPMPWCDTTMYGTLVLD